MGDLMAPPGPPKPWVRVSLSDQPRMESDDTKASQSDQKIQGNAPLWVSEKDSLSLGIKWSQLNLNGGDRLKRLPRQFYDNQASLNWKHQEDSSTFWGTSVSFGSASDQPFSSGDTSTLNITGTYSSSQDPTSRWVYFLNYSNNRTFLNHVPIPGFAYIMIPNADFVGVFGIPFAMIRWKFSERWSTSHFLGPFVLRSDLGYSINGPIQAYTSLESSPQTFYREGRAEKEDRFFYNESRWSLGLKTPLSQQIFVDLYGGLTFNRSVFEDKNYSLDHEDLIRLQNRYLMGLQLTGRF